MKFLLYIFISFVPFLNEDRLGFSAPMIFYRIMDDISGDGFFFV